MEIYAVIVVTVMVMDVAMSIVLRDNSRMGGVLGLLVMSLPIFGRVWGWW